LSVKRCADEEDDQMNELRGSMKRKKVIQFFVIIFKGLC